MPVPTYTVPTNNSDTATEEPKITIALSDLKDLLTGNLDNDNVSNSAGITYAKLSLTNGVRNADVKSDAAIAYSKLATLNTGQILAGFGGIPTATTPSGAVAAIGATGAVSLSYQFNAQVGTTTIPGDGVTFTTVASLTVTTTGTYVIIGKAKATESVATSWGLSGRLRQNFTTHDEFESAAGGVGNCGVSMMSVTSLTAGDLVAVQIVGTAGGGTITGSYGRLYIQRLA